MRNNRLKLVLVGLLVGSTAFFTACDRGDTGQNLGNPTPGAVLVANGGFGSTLNIDVQGDLRTGDTVGFFVEARDPNGAPLPFLSIFCDTEDGLALLEPTSGSERTDQNGLMSGVIGGENPGSFVLECRGPAGSGLRDRVSIVSVGEIPGDFAGFAGSAGGNLGGGAVDGDLGNGETDVFVSQVEIQAIGTDAVNSIDLIQNPRCNMDNDPDDPSAPEPEPFGIDNYVLSISNPSLSTVEIDSVSFTSGGVVSSVQLNQITIPAGGSTTLSGPFSSFNGGGVKVLAGTTAVLTQGLFNTTFTVTGSFINESQPFTVTRAVTVVLDNFDNCP